MKAPKVEICNEQEVIRVSKELESLVNRAIVCSLLHEKITNPVSVSVTFVDNPMIRGINRDERGIDSETDVLSFPMLEFDENHQPILAYQDGDFDMEAGLLLLGDIVISLERAAQQAEDFNHSFERETAYLTVHSVLHLLGYDHMEEDEKKVMRGKEEAILAELDLVRES